MNWPWQLGMMIVAGVPAIIGGGLAWQLFQSWTAVAVWLVLLLIGMGFLVAKHGNGGDAHT